MGKERIAPDRCARQCELVERTEKRKVLQEQSERLTKEEEEGRRNLVGAAETGTELSKCHTLARNMRIRARAGKRNSEFYTKG